MFIVMRRAAYERAMKSFREAELAKSLADPSYESAILKAREGLVPRRVTVTNRKTGRTYQKTVWVRPDTQNGRFEFTQELKQKAVSVLNSPTEKINYVDYTRENYNKLFPRGECQTPLGTVKLSPKQFERLEAKDGGARVKFMGALQQCLRRPDVIIGKTDNKGRYSKLYLKAFLDDNGKKAYLSVVPNIDGIDIVVSNSPRDTKDIAKEIKKAGICYYIRPAMTSSA